MSKEEPTEAEIQEIVHEEVAGLLADDTSEKNPHISTVPVIPQLGVALLLLVLVFSVTYVGASRTLSREKQEDAPVYVTTELAKPEDARLLGAQAFDSLDLEARSAVVWDVTNQRILFNKNADSVRPLASITKLMTALLAYELLDPTETITITQDALEVSGDSGFAPGEKFTLQNLADLVLIASSNDGATALSNQAGESLKTEHDPEQVFVRAMNVRAEELGLTKTKFKNSTGLDVSETEAGAEGSARDVARLMDYIITHAPDTVALTNLEMTTILNESGEVHLAKNTNEVVDSITGLIASKTGYTTLSGGNLAVAFNAGLSRPIVVVVLGSSYEGRFTDTEKLIERVQKALARAGT